MVDLFLWDLQANDKYLRTDVRSIAKLYLRIYQSIHPSIYLSLCLFVRPFVCLSLPIYPIYLSNYLFYLSIDCSGCYGEFSRNNVNSTQLWNQNHDKLHAVSWWKLQKLWTCRLFLPQYSIVSPCLFLWRIFLGGVFIQGELGYPYCGDQRMQMHRNFECFFPFNSALIGLEVYRLGISNPTLTVICWNLNGCFQKFIRGTPKSSILTGVSIIFTMHFGGKIPLFWGWHPNMSGLYFHPYLGKWSNLANIFQMGWNCGNSMRRTNREVYQVS